MFSFLKLQGIKYVLMIKHSFHSWSSTHLLQKPRSPPRHLVIISGSHDRPSWIHEVVGCAGAPVEAAWGGGGGEPDIPQWLRYGEADVHDALSSNSKLRPDQVRASAAVRSPAGGRPTSTACLMRPAAGQG